MKLKPIYSYEFNSILNELFSENENLINYTSIITDKDRFEAIVPLIEKNKSIIEKTLGYKLNSEINFYIVRAEKFKSFSLPITIEYSILPEEMAIFLLKEIVKTTITDRFIDEVQREEHINSAITHILINGDFGKIDLIKFIKNLHNNSRENFKGYKFKKSENIKFFDETVKEKIKQLYSK